MKNPKNELRSYLERLIHRYLNVKSLLKELKSIEGWQSPSRIETFNLGQYFFQLVTYSLSRTVFVELSMLLSKKEQRSLVKWLEKAREHAASLAPTRYISSSLKAERQPITSKEYRSIIDCQVAEIAANKEVIERIKSRRDKSIAHLDKTYFDNPNAIYNDYPLSEHDIDDLMKVLGKILRKQYSLLSETDMRMEVLSVHNVDTVLQYARAFLRARQNFRLIEKGFKPSVYMEEDYRLGSHEEQDT